MFFDTHAHLCDPAFEGDVDGLIKRADEAEVTWILSASTDLADSAKNIAIARSRSRVLAAAGVHPESAGQVAPGWEQELDSLLAGGGARAVGECGLDAFHPDPPREIQEPVFRAQIRLALKHRLPMVIHSRKAGLEVLRILEEEGAVGEGKPGGVFHCAEADEVLARAVVKAGFHLGVGGTVTYPKNDVLRNLLPRMPLDRLLLETDSPYLAPQPVRGKRNEPAFITHVAAAVAQALGIRVEEVGRRTRENGMKLFVRGKHRPVVAYDFKGNLYVNLTNRCTAHCAFCTRETTADFRGLSLRLTETQEPSVEAVVAAAGEVSRWGEIVFCGYGEPTMRLAELVEAAGILKKKGARIRLNTNGHGSLFNGRDIVPELAPVIDQVSISLDAHDEATYLKMVRPEAGPPAWKAVQDFIKSCVGKIPVVVATVVGVPGVDIEKAGKIAEGLGAKFAVRPYFQ